MRPVKLKKINYITDFKDSSSCEWADISVELEDGRLYSLTVETTNMIKMTMKENKKSYFFEEDLLVVDKMTKENIENAIKDIIENDDIEKYGILQK